MRNGKLYTSYFAKLKKEVGFKISIARFNPSWLKEGYIDCWFKDLAPSKELLNDYKYKGIDWIEYTERYKNEVLVDNLNKLLILLDSGQDVTVYCYEKSTDNCHRHILGNIIKNLGYEVEEIK